MESLEQFCFQCHLPKNEQSTIQTFLVNTLSKIHDLTENTVKQKYLEPEDLNDIKALGRMLRALQKLENDTKGLCSCNNLSQTEQSKIQHFIVSTLAKIDSSPESEDLIGLKRMLNVLQKLGPNMETDDYSRKINHLHRQELSDERLDQIKKIHDASFPNKPDELYKETIVANLRTRMDLSIKLSDELTPELFHKNPMKYRHITTQLQDVLRVIAKNYKTLGY